ncbi:MAG: AtpZ/AtpI family protein [Firmicutes bacterium]|nr:AtpZ/AtpI family protein [Bacillota bacterium]
MRSRIGWILTASKFTLGLAIGISASYYLGNFIDARYGTGSIFSSLLVLITIAAGFYNLYRYVTRQDRNIK